MTFNLPSNGGCQFNYNNSEMFIIYQSSSKNYIGNSYNNFLINTGNCGIITKSMHSSPN